MAAPISISVGRSATVARWLALFTDDEIRTDPALVVSTAWWALGSGDRGGRALGGSCRAVRADHTAARRHTRARRSRAARRARGQGWDRTPPRRCSARFRASPSGQSVSGHVTHAQRGGGAAPRRSERGERSLEAAVRQGGGLLPAMVAPALGQLALLAADEGDWVEARHHVERGLRLVDEYDLRERPPQAPLLAAAALVYARTGEMSLAMRDSKRAGALLASLVGIAPWAAIDSQICLARYAVMVGDVRAARQAIRDAHASSQVPGRRPARRPSRRGAHLLRSSRAAWPGRPRVDPGRAPGVALAPDAPDLR